MESDWQDIRDQTTWSPDAFAPRVYEQYVSWKPRMSGTRAGRWPSVWWVDGQLVLDVPAKLAGRVRVYSQSVWSPDRRG